MDLKHQHNPITVHTTHEGTEISLHRAKDQQSPQKRVALCLGFIVWIVIGGFFGAMVVKILSTYFPYPSDMIAGLKILGGFIGWMSSGIFLLYRPATHLFGREKIRLSPEGMRIGKSVLNIEWTHHYPFQHIFNLRLRASEGASAREGILLFDDYARHQTVTFGMGLAEPEAKRLVNIVAEALMTYSASPSTQSSAHAMTQVIFGDPPFHVYYIPPTTIHNPDVPDQQIPYTTLRHIIVYTATYEFHQVERFLTDVVNTLGQKRFKAYVDVHIYGNPEHVQRNLLNNFANLCKQVHVHATDDIVVSRKKKAKGCNVL